jgi:hypothetical protein
MYRHVMRFEYYIGQQADFAKPSKGMKRFSILAFRSKTETATGQYHAVYRRSVYFPGQCLLRAPLNI